MTTPPNFNRCVSLAKKPCGFTLVELIVVLVIIATLGVGATSRFFERPTFDNRGFYDGVVAVLRHAQKSAITQRRTVCVSFTISSVTLNIATNAGDTACGATPLINPATGTSPYTLSVPANSAAAFAALPANFTFDALGRAIIAGPGLSQSIQVAGLPAFTVEGETGYVHP